MYNVHCTMCNVQEQWRKKEERVQAKALASQVDWCQYFVFIFYLLKSTLKVFENVSFVYVFYFIQILEFHQFWQSRSMENLALVFATQSKCLR